MESTTYIALSRQMGLRREMDIVAHNIANAETPAYKAERMIFREFITKPEFREELSFVQDIGQARDLSEGPLKSTGNPLDLAINGEGYFVIDTPLGERFTRHGRFQLDAQGQIVTGSGSTVLSDAGPIQVSPEAGEISIASDGTVSTAGDGIIGKLRVVSFEDEQRLKKGANGLYRAEEDQTPVDVGNPTVAQGMIESSNVEPILELTRMMKIMRSHQSVGKFIQQEDDRVKQMIRTLGKQAGA